MKGNWDSEIQERVARGIRNLGKFSLWNPESWAFDSENNSRNPNPTTIAESGIQDPPTYRIFAIACFLNSIVYQFDVDRVLWECKFLLVLKSLFKNAGKLS